MTSPQLALGTVQFGLPYGATNPQGQVAAATVRAILEEAAAAGIRVLDTAAAYGNSEAVLGEQLAGHGTFRIVTKTLPLRTSRIQPDQILQVKDGVMCSLDTLRVPRLDALLVHHADDLLNPGGDALFTLLQELQTQGLVDKLGASVYTREQVAALVDRYPLQIVQLPMNALDQAFLAPGAGGLADLRARDVEVHVRSVFLQGILLQEHLPAGLQDLAPGFQAFRQACASHGLSPLAGCLAFARQQTRTAQIVVGVTSVAELRQILAAWDQAAHVPDGLFATCNMVPHRLLNPAHWPAREELLK